MDEIQIQISKFMFRSRWIMFDNIQNYLLQSIELSILNFTLEFSLLLLGIILAIIYVIVFGFGSFSGLGYKRWRSLWRGFSGMLGMIFYKSHSIGSSKVKSSKSIRKKTRVRTKWLTGGWKTGGWQFGRVSNKQRKR